VVLIYPLLGNGFVFYESSSRLYKWYRTELNQREREREGEKELEWIGSSAVKEEGFG
jgi:hypothetical protein